jgi:hypothetical protein
VTKSTYNLKIIKSKAPEKVSHLQPFAKRLAVAENKQDTINHKLGFESD